ncbi:MAG: 50S ribosomal protein L31 [Patescibacteria group bacterium]
MRPDIHPNYVTDTKVACACGNTFVTGSTMKEIRVELCNQCHPFYTGKQKFVDTARRVEKFQEKMGKVSAVAAVRKGKKVKKVAAAKRHAAKTAVKKAKKEAPATTETASDGKAEK